MTITDVQVKPVGSRNGKLGAFCSLIIDDAFAIHDVKIIEGTKGVFVAMPTRKLMMHCGICNVQNPISASFCNGCGKQLESTPVLTDKNGRVKVYFDIAHPINHEARAMINEALLKKYYEVKSEVSEFAV